MELTREELIEKAKGYQLTSDFYREVCSRGEIVRRYKRHFLHNITSHMVRDRLLKKKWTQKVLRKEAKKYKSRADFERGNAGAYSATLRFGSKFSKSCCRHMLTKKQLLTKWTKKRVKEEALKYKTRTEFKKGNAGAYGACIAFGPVFREKCFKHLPTKIESLTKWNKELIKKEALKYTSRTAFKRGTSAAYSAAVAFGKYFLDNCCKHMLTTKEVTTYWTKELVRKEAIKYTQRRQFKISSPQAYIKSLKFGKKFHDKICAHMSFKYINWSDDKIIKGLLKYKSFSEVRIKNYKLIHAAAHRSRAFYKKVTSHLIKEVIPQERNYTEQILILILKKTLKKFNNKFEVIPEFYFTHNCKNYFIDLVIKIPHLGIIIPVEIKHDNRSWKLKNIKTQLKIYNEYFKKTAKSKVFLVSPKGRYGISEEKFISILISCLESGKLENPKYNIRNKCNIK